MSEENQQTDCKEEMSIDTPVEKTSPEPSEVKVEPSNPDPIAEAEKAVRKIKFDTALQALIKEHNCELIPIVVLTAGQVQAIIETRAK